MEWCGIEYNIIIAEPLIDNIHKVNNLFDKGFNITLSSVHGSLSNINFFEITYKQLIKWNVKFHELRMSNQLLIYNSSRSNFIKCTNNFF